MCIEPELQPVSSEPLRGASANCQDGARLDVAANRFLGGTFQRMYLDIRVFNPFALSNRNMQLSAAYRKPERIKKRAYEQRIRDIEHASFTPLVVSATGELGNEANHSTIDRLHY